MPSPEDLIRLRHMLDAARKAVSYCAGKCRDDLDGDELLALALARLLEIVGEAAKTISPTCRSRAPKIPWREIAGTRDRLIHGYAAVDLDIVWAVIEGDLPPLIEELETLVAPVTK